MHAVRVAFIFASHLLSLALAVYTTRTSGVPVVILFYAFIIEYGVRLITIQALHADLSRSRGLAHAIAPYISRRPTPRLTARYSGTPARPRKNAGPAISTNTSVWISTYSVHHASMKMSSSAMLPASHDR